MALVFGADQSGNNNIFTEINLSTTVGVTYDSMLDSPTDVADSSGNIIGNYCTLDNATRGSMVDITNGGLTITGNTADNSAVALGTIDVTSGKWYWENTVTTVGGISYIGVGRPNIAWSSLNNAETAGDTTNVVYMARSNGQTFGRSDAKVVSNIGITFATGDVLGLALDMDSGAIYISRNNTWVTSGNPTSGMSKTGAVFSWTPGTETMTPMGGGYNGSVNNFNFGQRAFTYTPPTGFKSLNTKNLNEQSPFVTGPDFVWIKRRNAVSNSTITDTVRGANRELFSSSTAVEQSNTGQFLQEFTSNGFTLGASASGTGDANISGGTYVGWNWNAGSRTIGNQDGTVNSTVRANPAAGFSIVTYRSPTTGSFTFGHELYATPAFFMLKERTSVANWIVWHKYYASVTNQGLYLNASNSSFVAGANWLTEVNNNTIGITQGQVTSGSNDHLVYCWSEIPGYSKFGTYTGNGSTDGPFIHLGFKPRWIMYKRVNASGNWNILDTARESFNPAQSLLRANITNAEEINAVYNQDFLSNGWKIRSTNVDINVSGSIYLYIAFAEQPFKYASAR